MANMHTNATHSKIIRRTPRAPEWQVRHRDGTMSHGLVAVKRMIYEQSARSRAREEATLYR